MSQTPAPTSVPMTDPPADRWRAGGPGHRLVGAAVFLPTLVLLLVAWSLTPDPKGVGTHEQMGLAPCGFKLATGLPCVTCGMTTSFAHAAEGDLPGSFATQPGGFLLAVLVAMVCWLGLWAMISGMSLKPLARMLGKGRVILALAVTLVLAWVYTLVITLL